MKSTFESIKANNKESKTEKLKNEVKLSDLAKKNLNHLNRISKKYAQKEIEISSLVYSMKRKMNKLYNQHLRLIKPVLNRYPKFWKTLNDSEKDAKGLIGWLNHMKTFYGLLINDPKYLNALNENSIDIKEIRNGQALIQALYQANRKLQKCRLEQRIAANRFKASVKDFDSEIQNQEHSNHYIF